MTKDLFGYDDSEPYPGTPGYKEGTTSRAAAEAMEPSAESLRGMVLEALTWKWMTADEVAEQIGQTVLAIRPRCSELRVMGLIEPSGERRQNISGREAHVWRRVEPKDRGG
jgi:predicted ArsR family transcriptional regulator